MWTIIIMGLIGAFIGWGTNLIAVKLLFRPIVPFGIPNTPFVIQGVIPKRHRDIAKSVAKTIDVELLDLEHLLDKIIEGIDKQQVLLLLEEKIVTIIKANLPSLLQSFSGAIGKYVHEMMERQGDQLLKEVTEALIHKAVTEVKISEIIEAKLLEMDLEKIEMIIIQLAKKELKQIEIVGGVLGLFIGLVQGTIALML